MAIASASLVSVHLVIEGQPVQGEFKKLGEISRERNHKKVFSGGLQQTPHLIYGKTLQDDIEIGRLLDTVYDLPRLPFYIAMADIAAAASYTIQYLGKRHEAVGPPMTYSGAIVKSNADEIEVEEDAKEQMLTFTIAHGIG